MDKKFSFKVFKNASEFEDWQRNEDVQICSISPVAFGAVMDMESTSASADAHIGAFVVYCIK